MYKLFIYILLKNLLIIYILLKNLCHAEVVLSRKQRRGRDVKWNLFHEESWKLVKLYNDSTENVQARKRLCFSSYTSTTKILSNL